MDRSKEIETINDDEWDVDRRDKVNIGAQYVDNRQEVLDTLVKFYQMFDWRLGRVDEPRHPIKRISWDVYHVNSSTYSTGPKPTEVLRA